MYIHNFYWGKRLNVSVGNAKKYKIAKYSLFEKEVNATSEKYALCKLTIVN